MAAMIPRLENASDADLAPLTVEDHELEIKRSHLDDVPLHSKRSRKELLPQIRDHPARTEHLPYLVMTLVANGGGNTFWVSPIRACVERLLVRQEGPLFMLGKGGGPAGFVDTLVAMIVDWG